MLGVGAMPGVAPGCPVVNGNCSIVSAATRTTIGDSSGRLQRATTNAIANRANSAPSNPALPAVPDTRPIRTESADRSAAVTHVGSGPRRLMAATAGAHRR